MSEVVPKAELQRHNAAMVHIMVRSIAGESLAIEAPRDGTIRDLKAMVWDCWHIPVLCQSLVLDTNMLLDAEKLADLFPENDCRCAQPTQSDLFVTVVITLEGALKNLTCAKAVKRRLAAEALGLVILPGPDRAIAALAASIVKDTSADVRRAALMSLVLIPAACGDKRAVCAFAFCLQWLHTAAGGHWREGNIDVRKAATEALASAVDTSDQLQIHQATKALSSVSLLDCEELSAAALTSLAAFDLPGDGTAFTDIGNALNNPDERVRSAVYDDLEAAAREGNLSAVAAACRSLRTDIFVVRRHALQALHRGWGNGRCNGAVRVLS